MKVILRRWKQKTYDRKTLQFFAVIPHTADVGVVTACCPDGSEFQLSYKEYTGKTTFLLEGDVPTNRLKEFYRLLDEKYGETVELQKVFSTADAEFFKWGMTRPKEKKGKRS